MSRWALAFFGLTPNDKDVIFSEVFDCVYYGKLSFSDAYSMPTSIRKWWINKLIKTLEEENNQKAQYSKAKQQK